jgi:tagaturonate reductase
MLLHYCKKFNSPPEHIALGFAAYLLFMRTEKIGQNFKGSAKGTNYNVDEEYASYYSELWATVGSSDQVVAEVLANVQLWGTDLSALSEFADSVKRHICIIDEFGSIEAVKQINARKIVTNETE